jgi:hypothetical protein
VEVQNFHPMPKGDNNMGYYEEDFDYDEKEESYPVSMNDWMTYNGLSMSDFI